MKDNLGLKAPRVYKVPCKCGATYISKMGHMMEECEKQQSDFWLSHLEFLEVVEHSVN
jgi:hypothetical protein